MSFGMRCGETSIGNHHGAEGGGHVGSGNRTELLDRIWNLDWLVGGM